MKGEPITYKYNTSLKWDSEKKGILSCKGKPDIEVACPPEFGGHPGYWSPEDLYLSSVEVCIMTTFLWFINKEKIQIKSYKSNSTGEVKMCNGLFCFNSIKINIKVKLLDKKNKEKVKKIFKKVKRACLISNSIKTDVTIKPEIYIE